MRSQWTLMRAGKTSGGKSLSIRQSPFSFFILIRLRETGLCDLHTSIQDVALNARDTDSVKNY